MSNKSDQELPIPPKPPRRSSSSLMNDLPDVPKNTFSHPVPASLLEHCVDPIYRQVDEFKSIHYTPVDCAPGDFHVNNTLRQQRTGRHTELLIAITMYNESEEFLIRTLTAIFRNIRYLCEYNMHLYQTGVFGPIPATDGSKRIPLGMTADGMTFVQSERRLQEAYQQRGHSMNGGAGQRQRSYSNLNTAGSTSHSQLHLESGGMSSAQDTSKGDLFWDAEGWQSIVVCLIADGRSKCHPRVLQMLEAMGLYQPHLHTAHTTTNQAVTLLHPSSQRPVQAHLYETTTQALVDGSLQLRGGPGTPNDAHLTPIPFLFCLKERNAKKLNSHQWLFRAIAPALKPRVCVLVDVGTRPRDPWALFRLWRAFDRNPHVAGACGEIAVLLGTHCQVVKSVMDPLIAAQNFEYKISNVLDKTLESVFGYISVLPGAFSAYRWEALQDVSVDEGPLVSYFRGEVPDAEQPKGNVFTSNMYLAEDRILCLELVAKRNGRWLLHYVKDAVALTDCPSSVPEFISQRRRWLNGTFFCQLYAIAHLGRFWTTRHSLSRKLALTLEFLYLALQLIFSWFGLANFYLSLYLVSQQAFFPPVLNGRTPWYYLIFDVLQLLYGGIIVAQFICSLGNRPKGAKSIFVGSMFLFAIFMLCMLAVTVKLILVTWPTDGMSWLVNGGTGRDVVLGVLSTFGTYVLGALLYGQLGHILSCVTQYLLLLPSFINTLTIYAFCNSHDVSWGTKGDDKSSTNSAIPAPIKKDAVESSKPVKTNVDIDASHRAAVDAISRRPDELRVHRDFNTKREDYYRNVRTWLVLSWVLSNCLLVAIVSSPRVSVLLTGTAGQQSGVANPYMAFLMYSVALFGVIRLIGAITYLILRSVRGY